MRRRELHGFRHENRQPRNQLDSCKPLLKKENEKAYAKLKELLKPAVKEVIVGVGDKAKKLGGKLVMYRHEFTYTNPTAIAIDVTDEMSEAEIVSSA